MKSTLSFATAHGIVTYIDQILGHKGSIDKFYAMEVLPTILSYHSAMKLELKKNSSN